MFRGSKTLAVLSLAVGLTVGCGDDDDPDEFPSIDAGPDVAADVGVDAEADAAPDAAQETEFTVTLENISDQSGFPVALSPGAWAVHSEPDPFFTAGTADRGAGLEAIAEDGMPGELLNNLADVDGVSSFDSFPENGPIGPGSSAQFDVMAAPGERLTFATMFIESNDVFVAPDGEGLLLFDDDGDPLTDRDVTGELAFWNAGTERDAAPGQGPNQAPRQTGPDTGPAEGVVANFDQPTRALPLPADIVDVSVAESNGTYTITVQNISTDGGAILTPISPVFYAVHDDTVSLFTPGESASEGLESLAEDGSPTALVDALTGAPGVKTAAAQAITGERPGDEPGPAATGETFEFEVTPDADNPRLSIASMVVESNDAFLALGSEGIDLIDDAGQPRDAAEIEDEFASRLAVWDAGTEANEVPGVGPNQAPRQAGADTGPVDPQNTIRLYRDAANDLAGDLAGGFLDVSVANTGGNTFEVTVTNTSDTTVYPGALTPVAYAVHSDAVSLFELGQPASTGLESLAEDGDSAPLATALQSNTDILQAGVANTPVGAADPGPLQPGDSYTFTVTPDADNRFLSFASMVVPSNDTFAAPGPAGIALLDDTGAPRSDDDINADLTSMVVAWDAGTEANQAGAAGPDQAPRQAGPDTGPIQGDGMVRLLADPVWTYPRLSDVVRVTIAPAE